MTAFIPKIVSTGILLFIMSVCFAQAQTFLSGRINGLDIGSTISVSSTAANEKIDSLTVVNDSFRFKLDVEEGDIYFLNYTANAQTFGEAVYLQKGTDFHIDRNTQVNRVTYTGSALANDQNRFIQGLIPFYNAEALFDKELLQARDSNSIKKMSLNKETAVNEEQDYCINWVNNHINAPFSVAVIYLYMQSMSGSVTKALYDKLSRQAKQNNAITRLMPVYFAERKIKEQFKAGNQIPDYILKDTAGNIHSLVSLKGDNYILLDIWASWCGPCRKSTPEIRNLLSVYGRHNFKVIGISADTDSKLWKEAIINDTMSWYHLSDLQGTDAGFMKDNNIFAYPTYVLISPQGTILSQPYSIEGVKEQVAQLFKNR